MDPSKLPPMRTGFLYTSEESPDMERYARKLVALCTLLVVRAQDTAGTYAQHAIDLKIREDMKVTWKDVIMALRYECRKMLEEDLETLQQDMASEESRLDTVLAEMGHGLLDPVEDQQEEESDHEDDEDDESWESLSLSEGEEEDKEEEDDVPFEPEYSPCSCPVCQKVNSVNADWSSWNPQDPCEMYLKRKTDETASKMARKFRVENS